MLKEGLAATAILREHLLEPKVSVVNAVDRYKLQLATEHLQYASAVERRGRGVVGVAAPDNWTRMSILNTARSAKLSSDRAIAESCEEICNRWRGRSSCRTSCHVITR